MSCHLSKKQKPFDISKVTTDFITACIIFPVTSLSGTHMVNGSLSYVLGAVGMPGLTALLSVREKGHVTSIAGQAMVISGVC